MLSKPFEIGPAFNVEFIGESLFLRKIFRQSLARKIGKKLRDRQCLRRPRFVRVASFRPNKGAKHGLSHDLTASRDALQVFSVSLRKPARRYAYRGLKIVTSLALRFHDFQRPMLEA
ncbi:hypothetical protein BJL95_22890 [Methylomonas sp. LWB]|nr:hypothetical protein BJL95_22890 [Methylomonas sp. LWB]